MTKYDVFVSFRHIEPDRRWARWLHRNLEEFRVPRELVNKGTPKRIRKAFLDEEELSASHRLSNSIERALADSRFLVVVCSPRAPSSKWVSEEVRFFRETRDQSHILALLIEGEPKESFPKELYELQSLSGRTNEPLAADVRPRTGMSRRQRRRSALLMLVATILGCDFADLKQRELERRHRRLVLTTLMASMVVVAMCLLAGWALLEMQRANRNAIEADLNAEEAWNALNQSRSHNAVLRAIADKIEFERLAEKGNAFLNARRPDMEDMRTWIEKLDELSCRVDVYHRATWAHLELGALGESDLEGVNRESFRRDLLDFINRFDRFAAKDGVLSLVRARLQD